MGQQLDKAQASEATRIAFIRHLLNDIEAMQRMVDEGLFETDITRIGAEQEFCLINDVWRPAQNADELLEQINDPHFTNELARYNLEINLDPLELTGHCFSEMEARLTKFLHTGQNVATKHKTNVLLTGILPTISKAELVFDYMTQKPRYWAMNDVIKASRGEDIELRLRGVDELSVRHDSVLFEACNTSFQLHLQVTPDDFVSNYNWAQAISGPVLAACTNSPLLLGRELWAETRIALFQQSIDTRNSSYALKNQQARVSFGHHWARHGVADVFKNDLANYKVLLAKKLESDSLEDLDQGKIPKLHALSLNNSTIYRWNRPCYGVGGGKPHLRIENRYIPSGPTILDEIANFALWIGIMKGRPSEYDDVDRAGLDFKEAKSNFIKAARYGLESIQTWQGKAYSAPDLMKEVFLPMAHKGLSLCGIDEKDINRYLGVIEQRVDSQTGSQWIVRNYRLLRKQMKQDHALRHLTEFMFKHQQANLPVGQWPDIPKQKDYIENATLVGHIMSTQLFTVNENDHADLATSIMEWKDIHHVPIETNSGEFTGLLTWTHMKRHKAQTNKSFKSVKDIMTKETVTVEPETPIEDAIAIMKRNEFGCLPVLRNNNIVGIITIKDVLPYDK